MFSRYFSRSHYRHYCLHLVATAQYADSSTDLKQVLANKIPIEREKIMKFRKTHGEKKVSDVTVNQVYGGMRDVLGLICETSVLHKDDGIKFRGLSIEECQQKLPKAPGGFEVLPEGLFWLLVTGEIPSDSQVNGLSKEWAERAALPPYIDKLLKGLPSKQVHPMAQISAAITLMSTESVFSKQLLKGMPKTKYWESTYEDAMNLIANITTVAAKIYRNTYKGGEEVGPVNKSKDWAYNFSIMLGFEDTQFHELLRKYLFIHSDHEGGNVSAHTTHLVASALSDCYLSLGAGLNGLAGPLHGLANQEVLEWMMKIRKEIGDTYTDDQLKKFILKTLKSGRVVPGYGHAVLRKTDPRYTSFRKFALQHLPDYPLFKLVSDLYRVVPPILKDLGKVKNPWPNVDAHSGVLLQYYGLTEMTFYTVLFGVARCLGVSASTIWDRALGLPIERPKSISTNELMKLVK